uniref:Uncharacterized protein n=1 Tax=Panagrolaimus sp. ES5 TaxID=591445 RepID=A0AC34F008_9BILA
MSNNTVEEPDFTQFQEPVDNLDELVSSPLPTSAAVRMYNRMKNGKNTYKRKSRKASTPPPPPLPSQSSQSTNDDDEISDDDGPDNTFDDAFTYPTPVAEESQNTAPVIEEVKKEKSINRWIFEEIIAFLVCIIYMIGFNILVKVFL